MSRVARTRTVVLCALVLLLSLPLAATFAGTSASPAAGPATGAPTTTPQASADDKVPPITVHNLQPSTLREGQSLAVTGAVRNTSNERWGDIQVNLVFSETPLTSADALTSARPDRDQLAVRQLLEFGRFRDLGGLEPGNERDFSLRVPYDALPISGASGVYVVGVEARATVTDGTRPTVATTTAFLPMVGSDQPSHRVDLAMLWPLTNRVPWAQTAYVDQSLGTDMAAGGRLRALTEMGASSGNVPLSWVVDPAVLAAAADLADGYPLAGRRDEVPATSDTAVAAASWLAATRQAFAGDEVLALPYGDPDVASLAHADLAEALTGPVGAASATLQELGISATRLLWPAEGMADQETLDAGSGLTPQSALLARQTVVRPDDEEPGGPAAVPIQVGDRDIAGMVYDRGTVSPRGDESMLQWRQQILAVAALRALDPDAAGQLVIAPPRTLTPDSHWAEADFFAGLRAPWLRTVPAGDLRGAPDGEPPRLRYPRQTRRQELSAATLDAVRDLLTSSQTLTGVLSEPDAQQQSTDRAVGIGASVEWRKAMSFGRSLTESHVRGNRRQIAAITVEPPAGLITLSGTEGRFPVTITNGLDQPITVSIRGSAGDTSLQIAEVDPVTIEPEQRRSIPLEATYRGVGISNVSVSMVDSSGKRFGTPALLRVRTTQIGAIIWVIMAVGAAVIFFAAGRSIVRRVRGRRRATGAAA
ncbi:MAG: hypothetical protein GEU96_04545 [Propionibacteriales bacterium]|nr:hypothetical protein [Propionibacteriales bacterium]